VRPCLVSKKANQKKGEVASRRISCRKHRPISALQTGSGGGRRGKTLRKNPGGPGYDINLSSGDKARGGCLKGKEKDSRGCQEQKPRGRGLEEALEHSHRTGKKEPWKGGKPVMISEQICLSRKKKEGAIELLVSDRKKGGISLGGGRLKEQQKTLI